VKFECLKAPSRSAINTLGNKFEAIGSVIDNKKGVVGKKKSVRTPENSIQDNLRRCETVSIHNSNAASPSWGQ
jgi:hypothetical protein